jgi:hypothetical protein
MFSDLGIQTTSKEILNSGHKLKIFTAIFCKCSFVLPFSIIDTQFLLSVCHFIVLFLNRKSLVKYSLPRVLVYSDASNIAAGAYTVGVDENIFHRMW